MTSGSGQLDRRTTSDRSTGRERDRFDDDRRRERERATIDGQWCGQDDRGRQARQIVVRGAVSTMLQGARDRGRIVVRSIAAMTAVIVMMMIVIAIRLADLIIGDDRARGIVMVLADAVVERDVQPRHHLVREDP